MGASKEADLGSKPIAETTSQPRPTTRLSKILSHTGSSDSSLRSSEKQIKNEQTEIKTALEMKPVKVTAKKDIIVKEVEKKNQEPQKVEKVPEPQKVKVVLTKPIKEQEPPKSLYGGKVIENIEPSSDESVSEKVEPKNSNSNKVSTRNISSTLASLATRHVIEDDDISTDESSEDVSVKPDDVLQTVKFGNDIMQQMRAKRNEILMSHETSAAMNAEPAIVRKDYSSFSKEKTITPTQKVVEKKKEEKLTVNPFPVEFESKIETLQVDMTSMIVSHKSSIESRVKEIISAETGELRKEFRQERIEQVR